jgi:hypothetical protein
MTHFGSLHRSTSAFLLVGAAAVDAGGAEAASEPARGGRACGFGGETAWLFCDETAGAAATAASFFPGRVTAGAFTLDSSS